MTDLERTRGTQPEQPPHIEINVDTVYVRTNIERVDEEDTEEKKGFHGWVYGEVTYGMEEYAELTLGREPNGNIAQARRALLRANK